MYYTHGGSCRLLLKMRPQWSEMGIHKASRAEHQWARRGPVETFVSRPAGSRARKGPAETSVSRDMGQVRWVQWQQEAL
jgi:hypothetical protein